MPPKRKQGRAADVELDAKQRIAIVDGERCRPSKCALECKRYCPVNAQGKFCVEVTKQSTSCQISEGLCSGCGICVRKCPFSAIKIVNLPGQLAHDTVHRYSGNGFKLHRLPMPRGGQVVGLLGQNGLGKSTALAILAGKLKPNYGAPEDPPAWKDILENLRGSALQPYLQGLLEGQSHAVVKPQYVGLQQAFADVKPGQTVQQVLASRCQSADEVKAVSVLLDLEHLFERQVSQLSGGELQRLSIATTCLAKEAQTFIFDEPSAYLDIKQRIRAAEAIKRCVETTSKYCYVVEHDLCILEFVSDSLCCLWGTPGAYGAVTMPANVCEGINHYLDGYFPTENLRFRVDPLTFCVRKDFDDRLVEKVHHVEYPILSQEHPGGFKLTTEAGAFTGSEVIVMLGENGMGKSTMIRLLSQHFKAQAAEQSMRISWKPQMLEPKFEGTVQELLQAKINAVLHDPVFHSTVFKALGIEQLEPLKVQHLSGGERQRVAIALALGKPADIYLIDEPSAYLDVEQRFSAARAIRRYMLARQKTAFVVEHDFMMATYMADRVIVFRGTPGRECFASSPQPLVDGMNEFLKMLGVTIRRSARNSRPRINKPGGRRDQEQKQAGQYFSLEADDL